MNYQELLDRFTYEDETEIKDRIGKSSKKNYRENRDIINQIVLWKLNRSPQIEEALIDAIYELETLKTPEDAVDSELTKKVVSMLLSSKGLQLPMASTVLHFYFPEVFPIIDQRAYRELYGDEYPKTTVRIDTLVNLYIKYIGDCRRYQQQNCPQIPFEKIDKILYQLDKEKGYKVKY